ncbi:MAG: cytochrome c biogenesis protein CcdA [Verrucomicrobiaceae bacterium]
MFRHALAACLVLSASLSAQDFGLSISGGKKESVSVSIVSEVKAAQPGTPFRVAVKVVHEPHFHTYGKVIAKGATGKPTKLTWTLPEGWAAEELPWPATISFESFGVKADGYEGTVHLPAKITPPAGVTAGSAIKLQVNVDGLVCDDKSCLPFRKDAALDLAIATATALDDSVKDVFASLPPLPAATTATAAGDASSPVKDEAATPPSFLILMISAFIGGLILNIMPCVFPVLGIKVVGIVQQAGEDRKQVVLHGLIYTLGILLSFWVLGGIVVALGKAWGFQLQSAGFNFGLATFFLIFGLNMAGVFEMGASAVGVGQNLQAKHGLGGSFFSGLLATAVSTPCSAPFLGTALGFAVKLPAPQAMLLFTLIGLGLASPFLLLSAFPSLVKVLPRPGAWMESFKQGMSFLLFGTVFYMLWVLTAMVEGPALLWLMLSLVLIAMACWVYGRWSLPHLPAATRTKAVIISIVLITGGLALGWPPPPVKHKPQPVFEYGHMWEPWSESSVQDYLSAGKPVYIDYTAKWCLTCQVNKRVYPNPALQELFKKHQVVTVRADFTHEDPEIKKSFESLGKGAVPVNVLHIPGKKDPVILPELLTPDNVSAALKQIESR